MAGTHVVEVKKALVAGLQALAVDDGDLEGVTVEYAYKPDRTLRERIYTGRATGQHEPANMHPGRTSRDEQMTFELVIVVEKVGGSAEDAEDRAVEIGTVVEEYIGDNRKGFAGAEWMVVEGTVDLVPMFNDSGALAVLTYTVSYYARLD